MTAGVLRIEGLTVTLPPGADRAHALQDVSLTLERGRILCVVGESGSGKSMTASAVMRLLPEGVRVSAGSVRLGDTDLLALDEPAMRRVRGARVAMIFQEPMTALNPLRSIGDQIGEVFRIHTSLDRAEIARRTLTLLEEVRIPGPDAALRAYPHELSGGQRQRAMIAMALALEPEVLIADEPTTALDVTTQAQILHLVRDLQARRGMAVLFITHDFGVVAEIADTIAVMQHGAVVEQGPADAILNHPQHPYTRALIAAVPPLAVTTTAATATASGATTAATTANGTATAHPPSTSWPDLIRPSRASGASAGSASAPAFPLARDPRVEPVDDVGLAASALTVTALNKTFGKPGLFRRQRRTVQALDDVNLVLPRGTTLGIVGESGSGKSTLARCIVRLVQPDSGRILLGRTDLAALSPRQFRAETKRIQMVFQDPYASLNPRRRVGELVAQGPMVHGVPRAAAMAQARELFGLVGLRPDSMDRFPHEFSGGQRQRIGLARALALRPEVLVADEAVSALDVSVQAQVLQLLAGLRTRLGLSMLFITHDLRVAALVSDRIAVMHRGRVVEEGPAATVFGDPQHEYTRALLASVPGRGWVPPA